MKATDKASKTARASRELPSDPHSPDQPDAATEQAVSLDGAREATLDGARLVAPAVQVSDASDASDAADEIDVTDAIDIEITDVSDTVTTYAENAATSEGYEAIEPGEPDAQRPDALGVPTDGELLMGADGSEERPTRKRLEEQLEALKRKETELRRALVIADHPELADAIRALQGRAYAIGRVEAKLAQGLSKAEERRRETLDKKLSALCAKRDELNTQIGALEVELHALGAERTAAIELERKQALEQLLIALGTHEPSLRSAGIDASTLVPELNQWLPEVEGLAERLVAERGEVAAVSEVAEPLVEAPASLEQAPAEGASGI
ncbi:MAG: hypothetical protein RLZZ450_6203 [Pseudomonadota bacterium]|jgi:hypothetical protein